MNCSSKVSIVVPSFKGGRFINQLCYNLKPYHDSDYQIIIVENGQKDGIEEVLKNKLPNAKYIFEPLANVSRARNIGVANSSGNFIQFLDIDDTIEPDKLEKQVQHAENQHLDLVNSDWHYVLHLTNEIVFEDWQDCSHINLIQLFLSGGWHPLHSYLFKRAIFEEINGFDEAYTIAFEDANLILSYLLYYKSGYVQGEFSNYHRYEDIQTLSYSRGRQFWIDHQRFLMNHFSKLVSLNDDRTSTMLFQKAFGIARNLAKWDMTQALTLYQKITEFDRNFKPIGESKIFQYTYFLFGYEMAEKMAQVINRFKKNKGVKGHNSGIKDYQNK